jgi:hypothetical protein
LSGAHTGRSRQINYGCIVVWADKFHLRFISVPPNNFLNENIALAISRINKSLLKINSNVINSI